MDYKLKVLTEKDLPAIAVLCQEASDYMVLATGATNPPKRSARFINLIPPTKEIRRQNALWHF